MGGRNEEVLLSPPLLSPRVASAASWQWCWNHVMLQADSGPEHFENCGGIYFWSSREGIWKSLLEPGLSSKDRGPLQQEQIGPFLSGRRPLPCVGKDKEQRPRNDVLSVGQAGNLGAIPGLYAPLTQSFWSSYFHTTPILLHFHPGIPQ